jgi:GntR family transcriptional regulator
VTEYDVTPAVARRAVRLLQTEGLVVGRQGAPAYVRGPVRRSILARLPDPDNPGSYKATSTTELADEDIAARLRIAVGAPVVRTDYRYRDADRPSHVMTSWEPMDIVGKSAMALPELGPHAGIGIEARMALLDITIGAVTEDVGARPATAHESRTLGIPTNATVLTIERTHFDADSRPVETADIATAAETNRLRYQRPPRAPE